MSTTSVATRNRTRWDIDLAHSSIRFSVKHLNISTVHGRFDRWTGSIALDETEPERSQVNAHIEAASINTHETRRDEHLRSVDFLDVAHHPEITFVSSRIERSPGGGLHVAGALSIASVTRTVALDVAYLGRATDPWGADRAVFTGTTTLDRRDFGLVWSQVLEAGGMLVGEKVKVEISIEAVRGAEPPAGGH